MLTTCLFIGGHLGAQDLNFRHLTIDDGLSQNAIFSIAQDQQGFMWFGTKDGLNRYDGQSFRVFRQNPSDTTSINGNTITELYVDKRGWIWLRSTENGINYYQPKRDLFSGLQHLKSSDGHSIDDQIEAISEDKEGNIWAGTRTNGLYRIERDPGTGVPTELTHYTSGQGLSNNQIHSIYVDKQGAVWIGNDRKISKYLPGTDSFHGYDIPFEKTDETEYLLYYVIDDIHPGPGETLWLGTSEGLMQFNKKTGRTTSYSYRLYSTRREHNRIRKIAEGPRGNLWLATPSGLTIFNPVTNKYTEYKSDAYDPLSISYNSITGLFKSSNGLMWVGTAGMGIDLYDPRANRFPKITGNDLLTEVSSFSIRNVLEDQNRNVWILADRPYRWDRQKQTLQNVNDLFVPDALPDSYPVELWDLAEDRKGALWAASTQGLIKHDPFTKKVTHFDYSPDNTGGLPQRQVYGVLEDSGGELWVLTENYLSRLADPQTGRFRSYRFNENEPVREQIRPPMVEGKSGNIWFGTSLGLFYFDRQSETFQHFEQVRSDSTSLSHNLVKSILPDPKNPGNYLWIGTSGGLNKLNLQAKSFTRFTTADGLPNNVVYGILPDNSGHLWLSTNRGLSKFNPRREEFRNYDARDGLQSNEFNTGAYFRSSSGELFFGGIAGLNYFYPEQVKDNPNLPEIVLTGFKIEEREITYRNSPAVLDAPLPFAQNIRVDHRDDLLTFRFAALNYSAPEKNQYAYKLEGLSDSWVESGNYATAVFTNIPHGRYTLRIKASNNDGVWNEAGIGISLVVTPPWWHTSWAYAAYLITFLLAGYSLRRYELNRFNLKNQLELERIQTESLRKLDHLKSEFFANISHEFRTPLTLILGQIENVISSDIQYSDKRKLTMATDNANRLLSLINQLLDLSKLEAGKMGLNKGQYNIVGFLKGLLSSFESLAESKDIRLFFESESDQIPVIFDAKKMERVILNLITNAFKFTDPGGEIGIRVRAKAGELVEIRVTDTGIGISPDHLNSIFDRFYQADSSSTRHVDGTGIGLALVSEFVKLHNGTIDVQSPNTQSPETGKPGTEFIIRLPIGGVTDAQGFSKPEHTIKQQEWREDAPAVMASPADLDNLKNTLDKEIILIVEDNTDVREFICEQLRDEYRILEADTGIRGLEQSKQEIPDLIISDLMMPEMDGFEFCRHIRQDEKTSHIPVIMLTAKAGLEHKVKGFETGIDAYLVKPFKIRELQARVRQLIQQRRQLRDRFSKSGMIQTSNITDDSAEKIFIEKAISIVENNFGNEQFKVEGFAGELNMSQSQLNRKLQALTDQTAIQFIVAVKLRHAAKLLKNKNDISIAEISYLVGYNDQAYFTRVFKKQFGVSPSEFRKG